MSSTSGYVLQPRCSLASRLPPELLDHIFQYCEGDIGTLVNCTIVCRSWMALSYPYRFANFTVNASESRTFEDFLQGLPQAHFRPWVRVLHLSPLSITQFVGWGRRMAITSHVRLEARVLAAICARLPRLDSVILSVPPSSATSSLLHRRDPGIVRLKRLQFEARSLAGTTIAQFATVLSYFADIQHLVVKTPKLTMHGYENLLGFTFHQPTVHNITIEGHNVRYRQNPEDQNATLLHLILESKPRKLVSTDGDHCRVASVFGCRAEELSLLNLAGEQFGSSGEDVLVNDVLQDCQTLTTLRLNCFLGVTFMDLNVSFDRQRAHWWRQVMRALIFATPTLKSIHVTFKLQERLPANIEEDSKYPEDRRPGPNIPHHRIARHLARLDWSLVPMITNEHNLLEELCFHFDVSAVCAKDGWLRILNMLSGSTAVTTCLEHARTRSIFKLDLV